MFKQILKAGAEFNAHQRIAPGFIFAYILIWLGWHNELFTRFLSAQGDLLTKASAALASLTDYQFFTVFIITCLFYLARVGYYVLKNKAELLLEEESTSDHELGNDLRVAKNADVERLLVVVTDLKEQLAESKMREKKMASDNQVMTEALATQRDKLDKLAAENALLKRAVKLQKAQLDESRSMEANTLETV